jgi:hypothetical protein
MDDHQFENWMKQVAAVELDTPPPSLDAIWWRAQLRRRLGAEESAARPIQVADAAAAIVCWSLAAVLLAEGGPSAVAVLVAITAVVVVGIRALVLKRI